VFESGERHRACRDALFAQDSYLTGRQAIKAIRSKFWAFSACPPFRRAGPRPAEAAHGGDNVAESQLTVDRLISRSLL
jgi:hypothetical protein